MSTIDELQHDYNEEEHQWFIDKSCDRAPTAEQMDRVMKLAKDALALAPDPFDDDDYNDLDEIRKELKHRINAVIDEEVK